MKTKEKEKIRYQVLNENQIGRKNKEKQRLSHMKHGMTMETCTENKGQHLATYFEKIYEQFLF